MAMTFREYRDLGATALMEAYGKGDLSPVEVTSVAIEAMEAVNPKINAVFFRDDAGARNAALRSEERWRKKQPLGPLDGVPTLVKDGLFMSGVPMYRGTAALAANPILPPFDAPCVARLRESGVILLGKSTMCDLGMMAAGYSSMFGPTRNPWDLDKTSGGSSSGTSAALAAGVIPIGVGTDIVGSIRVPASFCGLAGLKPSYGRVPYYPNSCPAAVAGPMARSAADMALLMQVIAGPDTRDFASLPFDRSLQGAPQEATLRGLRFGFLKHVGFGLATNAEVAVLVEGAVAKLQEEGAVVEDIDPPFNQQEADAIEDFYRHRSYHELKTLPVDERAKAELIDAWARKAAGDSGNDHHAQFLLTQLARDKAMQMLADHDVLVLPTVPITAFDAELSTPEGHGQFAPFCNTLLFNLTEQPALSLNCGFTLEGMPVGLQLVLPRFADRFALDLAVTVERVLAVCRKWPNLA
ncbi:amidase [Hoeflea sp. WL0058]|uniref:Amidase n=1 Tax=Flavimaribacter sediminis TaxID=2865987 RepID=A0AAE3D1N2_9HYPH|nr:amidase family protein [Flavimaribacter sediminis]MBW8639054.1 amidase [Flavimaribacter sediminis]